VPAVRAASGSHSTTVPWSVPPARTRSRGLKATARLAPQPRGAAGEKLDDVTGYNFVVMGTGATISGASAQTRQAWRALGVQVLTDPGPAVSKWLTACGASAALVRPDRYAYALAASTTDLDQRTAELAKSLITHPAGDA
jgi:3-(3-hydroxy-phenyl)propionate hydroxylase